MTITPPEIGLTEIALIAASHSEAILSANLARSPLYSAVPVHVERGAPSAAIAYNRGLAATSADIVIFAHHDVYLPPGWEQLLAARLREVAAIDPDWGMVAALGIDAAGVAVGPVWSSSLGAIVGRVPLAPVPIQSCDEMLIVLRRSAGLRFDEALPGWHMYGTDIVQTARAAGKGAWSVALPCIHNDRFHGHLGPDFDECYRFMQRKWAAHLPIRTPVTKITANGLHRLRQRWHSRRSHTFREGMAVGTDHDPERLAALCGWSDLAPSAG